MSDFADQVLNTNDYVDMLDTDPIALGCDYGGTLTYTPGDSGTKLTLAACAFTFDQPVTGTGAIAADGGITLHVKLTGGMLTYIRRADGSSKVTGSCETESCLVLSGG